MVTVDCIRGTYVMDAVKLVHDFGKRMNDAVDIGQIEGGLVQGLGWMTMEEIVYNDKGKLLSNALSTYKMPGHPQRSEGDTHRGVTDRRPSAGHPPQQGRGRAAVNVRDRGVLRDPERSAGRSNPKYVAKYRCAVYAGEGVDGALQVEVVVGVGANPNNESTCESTSWATRSLADVRTAAGLGV